LPLQGSAYGHDVLAHQGWLCTSDPYHPLTYKREWRTPYTGDATTRKTTEPSLRHTPETWEPLSLSLTIFVTLIANHHAKSNTNNAAPGHRDLLARTSIHPCVIFAHHPGLNAHAEASSLVGLSMTPLYTSTGKAT